jgi:hypothetical protein
MANYIDKLEFHKYLVEYRKLSEKLQFDNDIDIGSKKLKESIKECLDKYKKENKEDKNEEHVGEYVAIIITEEDDSNQKVFDEPNKR